jgi:putative endonuclease
MNTTTRGNWGEEIACKHLISQGAKILKRNFHSKFGEIDIIAKEKDCIIFVEVKTRKNNLYGNASEFVTKSKQRKIILTAQYYLRYCSETQIRFDVIEVYYYEKGEEMILKEINQIKNAFIN